jgi:hypothetical protein
MFQVYFFSIAEEKVKSVFRKSYQQHKIQSAIVAVNLVTSQTALRRTHRRLLTITVSFNGIFCLVSCFLLPYMCFY